MPGSRLSSEEKRLLKFWTEPLANFKMPLLKGLTIKGPPALRGIERLRVPFDYPITAICGRNGVGKSTILALVAFSSHRPTDWLVTPWPTRPTRKPPRLTSYAWKDFFFRHADDPPYDGLNIRFSYSLAGDDIEIERRWINGQWRTMPDPGRSRMPSFPTRPIEFVSLARILPPAELQHVRRNFGKRRKPLILQLEPKMCAAMSAIFRRTYSNIEIHEVGGVSLARCSTDADYTGFDMGAGENAMIAILARLQLLPEGGLLIVEEIEHGLHPEAQHHLVDALTRIVRRKQQQIIFTTHSSHLIDRLPRAGRVLLERVGSEHRAVSSPTTRLAMASMTGSPQPEATLYVEDNFSAALVNSCLPPGLRRRMAVIPIGDSSKVAAQLGAHKRGNQAGPALCIFDGDCSLKAIETWMKREDLKPNETTFVRLPGEGTPPEKWVLQELRDKPYLSKFSDRIEQCPQEADDEITRLLAVPDHHNVPHELALRMGISEEEAVYELVSSLAPTTHPDLKNVREATQALLK